MGAGLVMGPEETVAFHKKRRGLGEDVGVCIDAAGVVSAKGRTLYWEENFYSANFFLLLKPKLSGEYFLV